MASADHIVLEEFKKRPGSVMVADFFEADYNSAMQMYYDLMGYGTYKPMEDDDEDE